MIGAADSFAFIVFILEISLFLLINSWLRESLELGETQDVDPVPSLPSEDGGIVVVLSQDLL